MIIIRLFLLLSLFLPSTVQAYALSLRAVNSSMTQAWVEVRGVELARAHVFMLSHPERLVIDIPNTPQRLNLAGLIVKRGLLVSVRQGHPTPGLLRLVFDVKQPFNWSEQRLRPASLRVNLSLKQATRPPVQLKREVVVVLDPGHGGHDPGAIGPGRRMEKHVVLAIARLLKKRIDHQPGMRAVLTRQDDYYVGLRQRLMIARKHNADIFISIHADAFINSQSHGASVFALSPRGATSEAARWLAEKENYSELGGVNLKGLDDKDGVIRSVLLDLSQTATISSSVQLGRMVLADLGRVTSLHNTHIEQARFVVLKSPDTPSILVETGFISNPQEAIKLTSMGYQMQLTEALLRGIKRYFNAYPPYGSYLEALLPHD